MSEADTIIQEDITSPSAEKKLSSFPKEIESMERLWSLVEPAYTQFVSPQDGGNGIEFSSEQIAALLGVQNLRDMVAREELAKEPKDPGDGWDRAVTERIESRLTMRVTPPKGLQEDQTGDVMVRYDKQGDTEFVDISSAITNNGARRVRVELNGEGGYKLKMTQQIASKEISVNGASHMDAGRNTLRLTEATTKFHPPSV